jgi:fucokinase
MQPAAPGWDYLILTASNALQADAYQAQLQLRQELGLLEGVREAFAVPDPEGRRIGSGGSTIYCISLILERERERRGLTGAASQSIEDILRLVRVLIVHAGGDSKRLPAYGPCGKIFIPLPRQSPVRVPPTLFDRLVPSFLQLPAGISGQGQIVVAAGDALLQFDPGSVRFTRPGIIALGCYATPGEASRHGVYAIGAGNSVARYLQKPSVAEQHAAGAINQQGQTALDIGIMHLDAAAAAGLMNAFRAVAGGHSAFDVIAPGRDRMLEHPVDLYREICCAFGTEATLSNYIESAHASGSTWPDAVLAQLYPALHDLSFDVELVPDFRFLHFGSTRQLIESGLELIAGDRGGRPVSTVVRANNLLSGDGCILGSDCWVEGCRIRAPLDLGGSNVIVGVDVDEPMSIPPQACLDVLRGRNRAGGEVFFIRSYCVNDTFKAAVRDGALFCGRPLLDWLAAAGLPPEHAWPEIDDPADRTLWSARVFPAGQSRDDFRQWLWMYTPEAAAARERERFAAADRYSAAEIAILADQPAFYSRRMEILAASSRDDI